ncbi:MAG: DUF1330 domain-containing protein [Thermoleophilia bacterium]|nr:DUF1330 domain-containing protein [Thermoleophilia bacterium]
MADPAIDPTADQIAVLTASTDTGPIRMINLLRFKDAADGIDAGVSGAEAYGRYGTAAAPFLEKAGGRVLVAAACEDSIIGPEALEWDMLIVVEYPSREAFVGMVSDPGYLEITAHRTAALVDSRLVLSKAV